MRKCRTTNAQTTVANSNSTTTTADPFAGLKSLGGFLSTTQNDTGSFVSHIASSLTDAFSEALDEESWNSYKQAFMGN